MEETRLIETAEALRELAASLSGLPELAIDTESNSFHNYHERICLLQISVPGNDYLIDPIALQDLSPLKAIFADPGSQKIFHAAENDIVLLKKHFSFEFSNIFDTLLAAQILGYREVGLASLLSRFFSIRLDKAEQRSDWSRRPLSADQMRYAVDDTRHLIPLRDKLRGELVTGRRLKVAKEEFNRLAAKKPVERAPDPGAYLRLKGARKLPPEQRGILQKLFEWRQETARTSDKPPFRILSSESLLELSKLAPSSWQNVGRIRGVTARVISRYGDDILAAIHLGIKEGETPAPRAASRSRGGREIWTDEMEERFRRLREWRNQQAETLNVEPFIVASNRLLVTLAREAPDSLDTLRKVPGIGRWRIDEYGGEILKALRESLD
jgi:ribonuclease D